MAKKIQRRVMAEAKILALDAVEFIQKNQTTQPTRQDFGRFAEKVLGHLEAAVEVIRSGEAQEAGRGGGKI